MEIEYAMILAWRVDKCACFLTSHHPPEHKLVDGRVKCTKADAIDLDDPRRRGVAFLIGWITF